MKLFRLDFFERGNQNGSDDARSGCHVKLLATFTMHTDRIKGCFIMSDDLVYVLTRDAKITAWKWVPFKREESESEEDENVESDGEMDNNDDNESNEEENGEDDRNVNFIKVKKGGNGDEEEEDDVEQEEIGLEDDEEEEEDEEKEDNDDNDEEDEEDENNEDDEDGDIKMEKPKRKWITRFNHKFYRKRRAGRWTIGAKYNIGASINQKVKSCVFHKQSELLVVGFSVNNFKINK